MLLQKSLFILLVGLSCSSSSAQNVFVVRRDVPENPSLVVVPVAWTKDQVEHADKVEELVIGLGLKVVERPATKVITETSGAMGTTAGSTGIGEAATATGSKTVKEEYIAYAETGAQYLLLTDEDAPRFKLIAIKTREVLASVKHGAYDACMTEFNALEGSLGFSEGLEYCLFRTLQSAGLPVRPKLAK
jgi:hypothetical protein